MKIRLYFGKFKIALLIGVLVLAIAAIVINSVFLAGVGTLSTTVPTAAGISLGCSALIILFVLAVFLNSFYKMTEKTLNTTIAFVTDKLNYSQITDVKENDMTHELFVVYRPDKMKNEEERASFKVLILREDYDKFIKALREKNPEIIYDTFSCDIKDDDNSKLSDDTKPTNKDDDTNREI